MKISLKKLSLIIFIVSTLTVIFSYFFSLYYNLVPQCIPFLDGCTSISRTGRYYPVNYFFKIFLFFTGFLILVYWIKNFYLLKNKNNKRLVKYATILGFVSIFFLFLYLFFLGENNYYRFFRKVGIFIYLIFSISSELLLSLIYYSMKTKTVLFNIIFIKVKLFLSILLTFLGIGLLPFMIMKIENVSEIRNIISWNFFFLIQINILFTSLIWKK